MSTNIMIGNYNNKINKSNKKYQKEKENNKHFKQLQKSFQLKIYSIQYMSLIKNNQSQ